MNEVNQLHNTPFDENPGAKKLPGSLNTLTILTFIGCGISFLSSIWGFANARKGFDNLEKLQESGDMDKVPGFMKGMMGPDALEMARKSYENRVPLLIIGLVAAGLCLYGAIQMRSLLKQGYYLWLIGEVLPLVSGVIFMGAGVFSGFGIIGVLFVALFVILYSMQLKYLR